MKKWTRQQIFSYIALLLLLIIRILGDLSPIAGRLFNSSSLSWVRGIRILLDWNYYLWENYSFILVAIVILVNRKNLENLNIDKYSVVIFVLSGLIYSGFYFWPVGWVVAIITIIMFILFVRGGFNFGNPSSNQNILPSIGYILIGFFVGLSSIPSYINGTKVVWAIHWFLFDLPPFVIMEEVIFRGLLWWFLRSLNWSDSKIVIGQAIIFWLSHTEYIPTRPFWFWIIIPVVSVLLGVLTWRTKSITPSTLAHILINVLWSLIAL